MKRSLVLAVLFGFLCGLMLPQPLGTQAQPPLAERVRDLERWREAHDKGAPESPAVYIRRIVELERRMDTLEQHREDDIRWFVLGTGGLLLAGLAFFLKRFIELSGKGKP